MINVSEQDYKQIQMINWDVKQISIFDEHRSFEDIGQNCPRYIPCPICHKCVNKASHLFFKCRNCIIPFCVHSDEQKQAKIKPDNFKLNIKLNDIKE